MKQKKMKRSPVFKDTFALDVMYSNANYLREVDNLQFKLDLDPLTLPCDATLESPNERDFVNVKQMIAYSKDKNKE